MVGYPSLPETVIQTVIFLAAQRKLFVFDANNKEGWGKSKLNTQMPCLELHKELLSHRT